jgi:hypothetical protein
MKFEVGIGIRFIYILCIWTSLVDILGSTASGWTPKGSTWSGLQKEVLGLDGIEKSH